MQFHTGGVGLARHAGGTPGLPLPPRRATLGRMNAARIALLALVCSLPLAASAQWQWIDKDGHKVFSDQAPPGDIPANRVLRAPPGRSLPTAEAPVASAAPATGAAAPAAAALPALAKPSGKDPVLEEKRKQALAAEAAKKKAEDDKIAAARSDNCERARSSKANFDSGQRIARVNAQGEREYVDDQQRAAEVKHLQEVIARDCQQQDRQ